MLKEDSRVGLAIDSGAASCASDLSESQDSCWEDEACVSQELPTPIASLDSHSRMGNLDDPLLQSSVVVELDGSLCCHNTAGDSCGRVQDLPRTPSFRSRTHRRQEEEGLEEGISRRRRSRVDTPNSWDDDVRILRHPRSPSLRFCLTLCTVTFVLMSLSDNSGIKEDNTVPSLQGNNIERKSFLAPGYSTPGRTRQASGRRDEGKYNAAKETADSTSRHTRKASGPRSNIAMARPAEPRPVFGSASMPQVEQFGDDASAHVPEMPSSSSGLTSNWTSWLAAIALIGMLIETGYKEYRQCRMNESHRHL